MATDQEIGCVNSSLSLIFFSYLKTPNSFLMFRTVIFVCNFVLYHVVFEHSDVYG